MWLISNIALNSIEDLDAVIKSNLLLDVTVACSDSIRSTKKEAINTICDILFRLVEMKEF